MIDQLQHKNEGINIYNALRYTKSMAYKGCSTDSPCEQPPKILLLYTDVKPNQQTKEILSNLANSGVKVSLIFTTDDETTTQDVDIGNDKINVQFVKMSDTNTEGDAVKSGMLNMFVFLNCVLVAYSFIMFFVTKIGESINGFQPISTLK